MTDTATNPTATIRKCHDDCGQWAHRHPCTATDKQVGAKWGSRFGCLLCGKMFKSGDEYRWIYANGKDCSFRHGNFFVCGSCDDDDEACWEKAVGLIPEVNSVLAERIKHR